MYHQDTKHWYLQCTREKRDASQEKRDVSQEKRDASQEKRDVSQEKRDASQEKRDVSQEKRGASQEKRDASRVSRGGNLLLSGTVLTRAMLTQENAKKCTYLSLQYPSNPTVPYLYHFSNSIWSGESFLTSHYNFKSYMI